jgi:hypothetical protein
LAILEILVINGCVVKEHAERKESAQSSRFEMRLPRGFGGVSAIAKNGVQARASNKTMQAKYGQIE